MKAKKLTFVLAALLSLGTLAACTSDDKSLDMNNYWAYDVVAGGEIDETLTYAVTFKEGTGHASLGYTLTYGEGTYVTTLNNGGGTEYYTYTTSLSIPVTYTLGEETETFTDTVTTSVSFKSSGSSTLRAKSSTKTVLSHSPVSTKPDKLENSYSAFHYTVETTYTDDGKGSSVITNHLKEDAKSDSLPIKHEGDYTYLDNELLLLCLRAVPDATTSGSVEIFNPFLEAIQKINLTYAAKTSGEFNHTLNGNPLSTKNISYREATFVLDAKNPGATQTAWIATADDPEKNTHRNVMLYLETPLSYSIGTLQYTLTAAQIK